MDFLTFLQTLARRWVLVLTGLVVTALGVTAVLRFFPPDYEASTSLLLTAPVASAPKDGSVSDPGQVNPYLGFGGALNVNAELLADVIDSRDARAMVRAAGGGAEYDVSTGLGAAPVVNVVATSSDAATASATARTVANVAAQLLEERQRATGAPRSSWIRVSPVTGAGSADRKMASTVRALVSVVVLGIGTTVLLTFTVEGMARRRRTRAAGLPDGQASPLHDGVHGSDVADGVLIASPAALPRRIAHR